MALPQMMQDVWDNHLSELTPMMKMYLETKKQNDDCIIFYRLGDFYEMFFDDAITASKTMEITLTGKSCGLKERAPMCGVPYHAVDTYINKLVTRGYKVCIVEQTEDPAQAKGLVRREVVRIVTPGTNLNTTAMDEGKNNYLMSIAYVGGKFGISIADVTTGDYYVTEVATERNVLDEINKFTPSEIICNHSFLMCGMDIEDIKNRLSISVFELEEWYFDEENCSDILKEHFNKTIRPEKFHGVISCSGTLLAAQGDEVTVVSPVAGVVSLAGKHITDGSSVAKGSVLLNVSAEKMATGDPGKDQSNALGSAGISVPGSAAETPLVAAKEPWNVASIALADGPAGLRLKKEYQVDDGRIVPTDFLAALEGGFFAEEQVKRGASYYQYCTAIPVGTLLAQMQECFIKS